jgi:anti-sigma B factor antagonist
MKTRLTRWQDSHFVEQPLRLPKKKLFQKIPAKEKQNMTKVNLTTGVRQLSDGVSVIDIHGEVNGFAENVLMEAYNQASDNHAQSIILNFSGLDYMNSSGIGLLVTLLIRTQRQKQRLMAYGLSEHYQQIFELTRLNEAISIYPNESEAVSAASA